MRGVGTLMRGVAQKWAQLIGHIVIAEAGNLRLCTTVGRGQLRYHSRVPEAFRQTGTLGGALRADNTKDLIEVVRENRHARLPQSRKHGVGESRFAQRPAYVGMKQDIYCRDNSQAREMRPAKPRALSLVDDGYRPALGGVGNRGCLSVIEGLWRRASNERLEVQPASLAETHDLDVTCIDKFLQAISMVTSPLSARIEFARNDVNRHNRVWQGSDDCRCAASCNQVDHRTGVCDQQDARIS